MFLANLTNVGTWGIPSASFSATQYLSAPAGSTNNSRSTGFDVGSGTAVIVSFIGTYTGVSLVHEQTLDPTGAAGWFAVEGFDNAGGSGTSTGSTSGLAYTFPVTGVLHRIRVAALSTGTLEARIAISLSNGVSTGGSGGGGGAVTIADGADVAEGAQADAAWVSGNATLIALGKAMVAALNTPASALPPPAPVAAGNTTFAKFVVNISTATTTEIAAAVSGQKTRLHKGFLVIAGANVLTFKRGSTALTGPLTFGSNGGFIYFSDDVFPEMGETAANEALNLTTTTTAAVGGVLQTVTSA